MNTKFAIDYVPSKDVREYLKEIDYEPTVECAALMIYLNDTKSLQEKFDALKKLKETNEDVNVKDFSSGRRHKSCNKDRLYKSSEKDTIFNAIDAYIASEEKKLRFFENRELNDSVYCFDICEIQEDGKSSWWGHTCLDKCFSTLDRCMSKLKDEMEGFRYMSFNLDGVSITRQVLDTNIVFTAEYITDRDLNMHLKRIDVQGGIEYEDRPEGYDDFYDWDTSEWIFDVICPDIPSPFKRGDIVQAVPPLTFFGERSEPVVVDWVYNDHDEWRGTDWSDLNVCGIMIADGGRLYDDARQCVLNVERVDTDKLKGKDRALIPLSSFMKGEINVGLFVDGFMYNLLEAKRQEILSFSLYTPEGNRLAGIEKETEVD